MNAFILAQLGHVALAHSTFTPEALDLIIRSSDGILRRTRNLCLTNLLEAVRDRTKTVDLFCFNPQLFKGLSQIVVSEIVLFMQTTTPG